MLFYSNEKNVMRCYVELLFFVQYIKMLSFAIHSSAAQTYLAVSTIYFEGNPPQWLVSLYPPPRQNEVLRGVYCFHVVRPSVRASVRP